MRIHISLRVRRSKLSPKRPLSSLEQTQPAKVRGSPPSPDAIPDKSRLVTICPIGANTLEFPETPFINEDTAGILFGPASTSANGLFPPTSIEDFNTGID
jgi:hypothetical protein